MPIKELQEPIWERQEGETPNQYCYFLEFLEYPTSNLREFHDYLCEKSKAEEKGAKLVTYKTIGKWAGEACNKWRVRKEAKRRAEKQEILETLHEIDKEAKIREYKLKQELKEKLLNRLLREAETEKLSQLRQGADAYANLNDDNRVDREEPTNYTKTDGTFEVETETTVNNPGLDIIAEAYLNGRKQRTSNNG